MQAKQIAIVAGLVMAGLVPAIHVLLQSMSKQTWMPGIRPGMTKVRTTRRERRHEHPG